MSFYNIVAATETSTVVAEYTAEYGSKALRSDAYQSEADLEKEFIRLLGEQGYAMGLSHVMENGHVVLKVTGSGNSQGHFGGSVGAGFQW